MEDEEIIEEESPAETVAIVPKRTGRENLVMWQKGKPKTGGKKKGYKSAKTIIRDMLHKLTYEKDGEKISAIEAIIQKQIQVSIDEGKLENVEFLLRQSADFIEPATPSTDANNFFNIETMRNVITSNKFLELDSGDEDLVETIIPIDESTDVTK
jgi:hypothetical protein